MGWALQSFQSGRAGTNPAPDELSIGDLKYTPGAGIRYRTPVGPIRLDVARKTANDEDFLPNWVFHISIGPAF